MAGQVIHKQRDFDNDNVQTSIRVNDGITLSNAGALIDALDLWGGGEDGGSYWQQEIRADGQSAAASPVVQGGVRVVLEMVDSVTGKAFKEFLPMPDLAKAADVGTNNAFVVSGGLTTLNPLHADYVVLKAELDARWESPDGNAGTLSRAYIEE